MKKKIIRIVGFCETEGFAKVRIITNISNVGYIISLNRISQLSKNGWVCFAVCNGH